MNLMVAHRISLWVCRNWLDVRHSALIQMGKIRSVLIIKWLHSVTDEETPGYLMVWITDQQRKTWDIVLAKIGPLN